MLTVYVCVCVCVCVFPEQAKDSDDDEEVVQVDRDHFMDEFFEQVRMRMHTYTHKNIRTRMETRKQ